MRRILLLPLVVLAGCATSEHGPASSSSDDAAGQCLRFLPPGDYKTLETATLPRAAIWRILTLDKRAAPAAAFDEYYVIGQPNGYPRGSTVPVVKLVLLQPNPNELVFCQIPLASCTPDLVWFKRVELPAHDMWQVDRTNEKEVICAYP